MKPLYKFYVNLVTTVGLIGFVSLLIYLVGVTIFLTGLACLVAVIGMGLLS